ncbi:MAG: cyclic nucleotide-binding domain-containing protein [Candidatus Wallbacteria bacterium]|nr:cyclic nucleotide-binding domain-containing protein [Candidatus Wallbacteria bacterium]
MNVGNLGKLYKDGEVIIKSGEVGTCMYVVQEGDVDVCLEKDGQEIIVTQLHKGDFFGEMAIFEHELRSATVKAAGSVHVLTVDKSNLLRRIQEDPSLAFRIVQMLSHRLRDLNKRTVK